MERNVSIMILFFGLLIFQMNLAYSQEAVGQDFYANCVVRDGRDGVPGPPGAPGISGRPGRDGRDCTISWSLNRVFEMEKRLRALDSKCEFLEKKAVDMKEELTTSKQQAQRLLRILAAKKILDSGNVDERKTYNLIPTPDEAITTESTSRLALGSQPPTFAPVHTRSGAYPTPSENGDCNKRLAFHVHDKVETKGAANIEAFHIGQDTFLAVANFHVGKEGYKINSFIYKMNPSSEKFEILQVLPTTGCRSMTYFADGRNSYLAVVNHFDGITHALNSVIYKWNGAQFVEFTKVPTFGASAAQFFKINGESFLAFANYRNSTSVSISSIVYKWNWGKLEIFQRLPTHGAVDCKFFRSQNGESFLVFANYYSLGDGFDVKSVVYKWDRNRFVFAQNVQTSAAISVDMFENNAGLFLALASHRTAKSWYSHTNVFRWNGTTFVFFQELGATAAIKVHHFFADGALYLTIPNYFDEITNFKTHSMVYKFQDGRFVKFQGVATTGAYDLQPFTYRGIPYLAAAFRFDGEVGNLRSNIYKMYEGCVTRLDALP